MKVLVTGGGGYIGTHTIVDLIGQGYDVVCADNQVNSRPELLDEVKRLSGIDFPVYTIDLCYQNEVENLFRRERDIEGIIHFAALKSVPESVHKPEMYYRNNLVSLLNVLAVAEKYAVKSFIFSSSCSVYGNPDVLPVTESTPWKDAESPYARTKQIGEQLIRDVSRNSSMQFILLRYFNPAGAHPSGRIGEYATSGEASNLLPRITGFAAGRMPSFTVFGTNYPTRDGSCIRDYIHVCDIASAHTAALSAKLEENCTLFNLGTGNGVTVLEMIKSFEKVSGLTLQITLGERREGDVVQVFADNQKAKDKLNWTPKYTVDDMTESAWNWEKRLKELGWH